MEVGSRVSRGGGFAEIWKRELGSSHPMNFARRIAGSEDIVKKINLYGKLEGHEGCVNTVQFNSTGEFVVSGSDDTQVIFWNWATKSRMFSYPSGHTDNIFQAKIMPFSDDRVIVTSAADGQVRLGVVLESGEVDTKKLGKHQGGVHNLAIEPGSPHVFYSCGEDAFIQHFDLRQHSPTKLFYCSSLAENKRGSVRLNAIVIDPRKPNYFAVGGYDRYARVYDIRRYQWDASSSLDTPVDTFSPQHLIGTGNIHITGLAYSNMSELLVTYNDELVYLFERNMGLGSNPSSVAPENLEKLRQPQVYKGHRNSETVKGVSFFGPNDEYVLSGSDCGHIFMWKKSGGELLRLLKGDKRIVNCLESHPHLPVLATSGIEKNVKLWAPMASGSIPLPTNVQEIMEGNRQGREESSQIALTFTPDLIMRVLRVQRRRRLAFANRNTQAGPESDEEDGGDALLFGFSDGDGDGDASSDGNSNTNPGECYLS
ncbi:hypothetical protein GIB67_002191 [Kingdonia uniflora]|uniref:DDB1-and CUL4-associated factor 8 n=1 Tax=Kingdonia uniflora TaxID=39325 RepID=A0A7J7KWP4_9MAGN|nr:hypothetical protein GIB67_002191 [Kingdonia uniflora]